MSLYCIGPERWPVSRGSRTDGAGALTPHQRLEALVLRKDKALVLHKAAAGRAGRRWVFSTPSVDRQKDTLRQEGWDLAAYRKNPLLLYAHDYHSVPIGKVPDVHVDPLVGLVGTPEWPPRGLSPFADHIADLVHAGFLNATSVGFRPLKFAYNEARGGIDFLEMELLEISIVPVPANAEALIEGRGSAEAVRRWIGGAAAPSSAWARGLTLEVADDPAPARPLPYARWR